MEKENLNKSLCEELSEAKSYQASLREISAEERNLIQRITLILEEMKEFCHTKKNISSL